MASEGSDDNRLAPPETEEELEVMDAIYQLANTVIANAASRTLTKYVPSARRSSRDRAHSVRAAG